MSQPTLKELCAKATPGPWDFSMGSIRPMPYHGKNIAGITLYGYDDPDGIANGQLIARLDPETVMKVYEALEWAEKELVSFYGSPVAKAISLLDGQGARTP